MEFFLDDRSIDQFSLDLHDGKATLTCTVIERWQELFGRVLKCGTEHTEVVTRRFGISSEEREDLEATIKGSFGLTGIAELKSVITGKVGRKLEFEKSQEIKREFKFRAPECGRLDLLFYQLSRLYKFQYEDRRYWHHASWTRTFSEWVDRIYDGSQKYPYDPNCDCKPKSELRNDGNVMIIFDEKIAMRTAYRRGGSALEFPDLDMSFPKEHLDHILLGAFTVHREAVPAHLLFLANVISDTLTARVIPYMADRVADIFQEPKLRHEPLVERKGPSTDVPLGYFFIGACIGTALGVLFAPKPSEEIREYLASKAEEGRAYAERKARELRERAEDLVERSKKTLVREKGAITAALEAGRDVYTHEKIKKT